MSSGPPPLQRLVQREQTDRAAGELRGPIRRVECEPYPRSVGGRGAHRSLESRYGRYACLAITTEFGGNQSSEASVIGHPYRLRIDFETPIGNLFLVNATAGYPSIGGTVSAGLRLYERLRGGAS